MTGLNFGFCFGLDSLAKSPIVRINLCVTFSTNNLDISGAILYKL